MILIDNDYEIRLHYFYYESKAWSHAKYAIDDFDLKYEIGKTIEE